MDLKLLWTIQLAPLAAFLLIQLLPKDWKKIAPAIAILFSLAAAAASLTLFLSLVHAELPRQYVYSWLNVSDAPLWHGSLGGYKLAVGFLVDPLNLLMITLVTTIAFFVQLFSFYYMAEDPSRARYFGFLSFFSFSMTGLVLSNNLLQTFLFWEMVGLTSYLLIGFWYEKPSAATAARKAFVINRLADLGFYLGILLLFILFGKLDFLSLQSEALRAAFSPRVLTVLGVLVFMGVMGKSAQFPFHVWLPDAMEGPTPVSALIHSATMVAAGVFLLARCYGLFSASAHTLFFVLVIGSLTALVGAALATIQRDIKKILAYSTVSQLGLMVMAMGAGSPTAGIFHLSTHAYFKSLLFLTSGAFIHRFHTNDIWEIGKGGGKGDKVAMAALFVGLCSLSGIPPFPGFFSKDLIFASLRDGSWFFYAAAIFASFLTVYYSFRMLFVILFSKVHHGHHEPHHTPAVLEFCRVVPLALLAVIAIFVGFLGTPLFHEKLLHWVKGHGEPFDWHIAAVSGALIFGGIGLAFLRFKDPELAEKRLAAAKDPLKIMLDRKFYLDDAYLFLTKKVSLRFAGFLDWFDKTMISGVMVNGTSYRILDLGKLGSMLQDGLLQDYISLAIGIAVIILFFVINFKI